MSRYIPGRRYISPRPRQSVSDDETPVTANIITSRHFRRSVEARDRMQLIALQGLLGKRTHILHSFRHRYFLEYTLRAIAYMTTACCYSIDRWHQTACCCYPLFQFKIIHAYIHTQPRPAYISNMSPPSFDLVRSGPCFP